MKTKKIPKAQEGLTPDYWRQLAVFDPLNFKTPVHIIGVGATGSWIALILAKMGVSTMTLWDFDAVEIHNPPNQAYGLGEVGLLKVEAMKKILERDCGVKVTAKAEEVDGTQPLSGIVYVCTDDMKSRLKIWEKALKLNLRVDLVVETRLAAELGLIYTVRPISAEDIDGYEDTLYSDEEAEESACNYRAISTMVTVLAGIAAHKLVKLASGKLFRPVVKLTESAEHESAGMVCINPIIASTNAWGK
jgi:molybdopterin/thiamine biosynthesis adenylyltransferase